MNKKENRRNIDQQLLGLMIKYNADQSVVRSLRNQLENGGIANFSDKVLQSIDEIVNIHGAEDLRELAKQYIQSGVDLGEDHCGKDYRICCMNPLR